MRSRLTKTFVRKTKQRLFFNSLGILVIIILLIKFGIPFLINVSLFLAGARSNVSTQTQNNAFLAAPVLDSTYSATNSATTTITGSAGQKETIRLFVNDVFIDESESKDDGSFAFKNVSLTDGDNTIKVKAKLDKSESDFSNKITITYKHTAPTLSIDSPSDGASFNKDQTTITVTGKTDADARVTVNDFWAIVDDKGSYSYSLHLQNGDNTIKVDAMDAAGNKTEKTIKVSLSQ
jgi:hypothetical protein